LSDCSGIQFVIPVQSEIQRPRLVFGRALNENETNEVSYARLVSDLQVISKKPWAHPGEPIKIRRQFHPRDQSLDHRNV